MPLAGPYRPRHPEHTAFYRCLEDYWEEFKEGYPYFYERDYGPWRPVVEKTVERFLQCGILRHGFARLRCSDCRREQLLAFACNSYYTSTVLPDIGAVFGSFLASGSSYMQSPLSLSLRYPTGKVPLARLTRTIREVVPSLGATSSALR